MSLKDLDIKPSYDSDEDKVLESFYIPVLSNSVRYYRLAGFFSSSALALAARGIAGLIRNDGEMKLIVSVKLTKEDAIAIKEGIENPDWVIEKSMIRDLENIEDELIKNHVKALGYLVANKKLEIKVAISTDESGNPSIDTEKNLFHQKVGIFEDTEGNIISFSGSVNESLGGWINNIEEFNVFRNWIEGEMQHLDANIKKFRKYWNNEAKRTRIYEIPDAIKEKLIKFAPPNIEGLNLSYHLPKNKQIIKLRPYQKNAISQWLDNGGKGIFEMATGTGKTFSAIGCAEELTKDKQKLFTVITCPFTHLVKQWKDEISKYGLGDGIPIYGEVGNWKDELMNRVLDLNIGNSKQLIVITAHSTFSNEDFINIVKEADCDVLLIADEVHGIGSPERRKGLIEEYTYRLGLSATPTRWLDDEGTIAIMDFFGKTIFEFPLKRAINEINPDTGETYLTPYEYYPYFVELTRDEIEKYERLTKRLVAEYHKSNDSDERRRIFDLLCILRQKIVVNAENKYVVLNQILDRLGNGLTHTLIYCSPQQIKNVQEILNSRNISQHKFTAKENSEERQTLLLSFAAGRIQVLVAMKCLDEGVDVPEAKTAIFLASSGNPKEFIQRRGRVLRRFHGKRKAVIYDILVIPSNQASNIELEKRILTKELRRYIEFSDASLNPGHCLKLLIETKDKFDLKWSDMNG